MVKIFYDLETTGTDTRLHSVHQIAGLVEVDGKVVEKFNIKTRPHPKAKYEAKALEVCGVTEYGLKQYQPMKAAHSEFTALLSKYVDRYDPKSKAFLIGFNNRGFDDDFLFAWFGQNKDNYIASWFYFGVDVMSLALEYLKDRREGMPSFKLKRVALELGLIIDESRLHDASYDVELTRQIYRIVTGLDLEL